MVGGTQADPQAARWRMLALLFVCRASLGYLFQAVGSVAEPLRGELNLAYADVGMLIGAFMLPGLVLSLPAGWLGRYLPDRKLVPLALLAMALGGLLCATAGSLGWLALGRVAAGAGFVFGTLYFTKMVAEWFAGRELATAMSVLVMSWPVGIALGQLTHLPLAAAWGWRAVFVAGALWCVLGALGVWSGYRPVLRPQATAGVAAAAMQNHLPRHELVLTLLAAAIWGLFNAGYIVFLSFGPRLLVQGGMAQLSAAATLSLASWVMVFSAAACGQVADRTGKRQVLMQVCLLTGAACLAVPQPAPWAVAWSLVFGLIGAAPAGVIMSLTAQAMAPQRRAFGMGVFFSGYFVIVTLSPPLAGWLYDHHGGAQAAMRSGAAMFALAAVLAGAFAWTKQRLQPASGPA